VSDPNLDKAVRHYRAITGISNEVPDESKKAAYKRKLMDMTMESLRDALYRHGEFHNEPIAIQVFPAPGDEYTDEGVPFLRATAIVASLTKDEFQAIVRSRSGVDREEYRP
jgi:hypothetical protein